MKIGITGGIGSGKSAVCEFLKEFGFYVINADIVAREVTAKDTVGLKKIVAKFGEEVVLPNGELNRKLLGEKVFSNNDALIALNNITHPLIFERISELEKDTKGHVFVEVPLLFECGMQDNFDETWLIVTDEKIRLDRIVLRDSISYGDAKKRMDAQMRDEEKAKFASLIIKNNGNALDLKRVVQDVLIDKKLM